MFAIDVEEKNAQTVEDFVMSEEKNDSKGIVWVPLEEVSVENAVSTRNRSRSTNTGIRGEALRTMGDVRRRFYELK